MSQKHVKDESIFATPAVWVLLCIILGLVVICLALALANSKTPGTPVGSGSLTNPDRFEPPTRGDERTDEDGNPEEEYDVQSGEMVPMEARRVGASKIWEGTDGSGSKLMFVIDETKRTYCFVRDNTMMDQGNYNGESMQDNMDVLLLENAYGAYAVPFMGGERTDRMYLAIMDRWLDADGD